MNYEQFVSDIRTYAILTRNENYKKRLLEAYEYIKSENINSIEDWNSRKSLDLGAFTYDEITIFDRIKNEEYTKVLSQSYFTLLATTEQYINDPSIGDKLASWGKIGDTPYRENLIQDGYVTQGLTEDETEKHVLK